MKDLPFDGTDAISSSVPLKEATIPAALYKLFRSKHDYGLNTVPQPNAGGTSRYWPRGAPVLGFWNHAAQVG